MTSIPVLVEARKEYTNQLQQILTPRLYEGFKSIYEELIDRLSEELYEKNIQSSSVIKLFQKSLKDIPLWNIDMIKNEHSRIIKVSDCDYLDNLIKAVFISNTKILTSVQINSIEAMNLQINVPQTQHFIHKCYIECSKEIYKNPYIFDVSKTITPKEKHNNLRETLSIINNSIQNAVRNFLPIRDILKQGLTANNYTEFQKPKIFNKVNKTNEINYIIKNNTNKKENEDEENDDEKNEDEENEDEKNEDEGNEDEGNEDEGNEDEENDEVDDDEDDDEDDDKKENVKKENDSEEDDDEDKNNEDEYNENDDENKEDDEYDLIRSGGEPSSLQIQKINSVATDDSYTIEKLKNGLKQPFEEEQKKIIFKEKFNTPSIDKNVTNQIIKIDKQYNNENKIEPDTIQSLTNELIIQSNNNPEVKNIELSNNPLLTKIDNIEKKERSTLNLSNNSTPSLNEVLRPSRQQSSNKFIKKINNKQFIKKMPSSIQNKSSQSNLQSQSFYQKKYDQNLANFNFSSDIHNEDKESKKDILSLQKEYKFIDLNNDQNGGDDSDIDFDA